MSKVIDISQKLKSKKLQKSYENHDYVLDFCEDVFPNGVVVLNIAEDGCVEMSSTVDDEEKVLDMLVASSLAVQKRIDENDKVY